MISKNTWMNNPEVLAQIGHVCVPYAVLVTMAFYGCVESVVIVGALFILWGLVKEFWYDANYELPVQTFKDNLLDFSMYAVGVFAGLGVAFL